MNPPLTDDDVPAFWQALGLPGLVDVHTHFLPKRMLDKVWAYFESAGPLIGMEWPIAYRHEEDERVARLRAMGVRAFTALVYPHKPAMAQWLNDWAADFARRTPDCLHTATFFPEESAASYVAASLGAGVRVFKAHIQVGGYDPRDPLLRPVWGMLADAGVPVVVHAGSGPVPGNYTGPGAFGDVMAAHPQLAAVIAHLGLPEYDAFLSLADRYDNVRYDVTMAFTDFSLRGQSPSLRLVGWLRDLQDRVLFGSDFPNIPYPYAHQLEALARLDLGDEWMRSVCWHNGARLFGVAGSQDVGRWGPPGML
jgi:predicted TIM-barrel fold metal-dependent hydrolase